MNKWMGCLCIALLAVRAAQGQLTPAGKDVVYAIVDGKELKLDVFMPVDVSSPPLVVWVHGGAWRSGTKENAPKVFAENGFALASIDFRQSVDARFPAQVHDIKAAIRFLRANAARFGYNVRKIAIVGSSSGGHLAALVGVTNNHKELEGTVGSETGQSSDVDAIIDYYGASNLTTILLQSTPLGLNVRKPALDLLLGGQPETLIVLARDASPVYHIDKDDPPLLIFHGDQDPQMPINQSHELHGAYKQMKLDVQFEVVYGAAHGGEKFLSGDNLELALTFLRKNLRR